MGSSMWECPPMRKNLPVQRLLQDITVGHRTVGLTKGICLVLDAEHGQVPDQEPRSGSSAHCQ